MIRRLLHNLLCRDDDGCVEQMFAQERRVRALLAVDNADLRLRLDGTLATIEDLKAGAAPTVALQLEQVGRNRADERIADLIRKRDAAEQDLAVTVQMMREAQDDVRALEEQVAALRRGADPRLAAENERLRRTLAAIENQRAAQRGDPLVGGAR